MTLDTWTISNNDETASYLRLPNLRPDVYIQNILLDTPGIRSNILDLISETINLCLKHSTVNQTYLLEFLTKIPSFLCWKNIIVCIKSHTSMKIQIMAIMSVCRRFKFKRLPVGLGMLGRIFILLHRLLIKMSINFNLLLSVDEKICRDRDSKTCIEEPSWPDGARLKIVQFRDYKSLWQCYDPTMRWMWNRVPSQGE